MALRNVLLLIQNLYECLSRITATKQNLARFEFKVDTHNIDSSLEFILSLSPHLSAMLNVSSHDISSEWISPHRVIWRLNILTLSQHIQKNQHSDCLFPVFHCHVLLYPVVLICSHLHSQVIEVQMHESGSEPTSHTIPANQTENGNNTENESRLRSSQTPPAEAPRVRHFQLHCSAHQALINWLISSSAENEATGILNWLVFKSSFEQKAIWPRPQLLKCEDVCWSSVWIHLLCDWISLR